MYQWLGLDCRLPQEGFHPRVNMRWIDLTQRERRLASHFSLGAPSTSLHVSYGCEDDQ